MDVSETELCDKKVDSEISGKIRSDSEKQQIPSEIKEAISERIPETNEVIHESKVEVGNQTISNTIHTHAFETQTVLTHASSNQKCSNAQSTYPARKEGPSSAHLADSNSKGTKKTQTQVTIREAEPQESAHVAKEKALGTESITHKKTKSRTKDVGKEHSAKIKIPTRQKRQTRQRRSKQSPKSIATHEANSVDKAGRTNIRPGNKITHAKENNKNAKFIRQSGHLSTKPMYHTAVAKINTHDQHRYLKSTISVRQKYCTSHRKTINAKGIG